jgi:hypothetical protein
MSQTIFSRYLSGHPPVGHHSRTDNGMKMRPMARFNAYTLALLVHPFHACGVHDIRSPSLLPHGSDSSVPQKAGLTESSQSRPGSLPRIGPSRRGRHRSHRRAGSPYRWDGMVTPCMGWKRLAPLHDHPTGRAHPLLSAPAVSLARRSAPLACPSSTQKSDRSTKLRIFVIAITALSGSQSF